jgi:hypothetical protein
MPISYGRLLEKPENSVRNTFKHPNSVVQIGCTFTIDPADERHQWFVGERPAPATRWRSARAVHDQTMRSFFFPPGGVFPFISARFLAPFPSVCTPLRNSTPLPLPRSGIASASFFPICRIFTASQPRRSARSRLHRRHMSSPATPFGCSSTVLSPT